MTSPWSFKSGSSSTRISPRHCRRACTRCSPILRPKKVALQYPPSQTQKCLPSLSKSLCGSAGSSLDERIPQVEQEVRSCGWITASCYSLGPADHGSAFDGRYWYLGKTALVYDETRISLGMELLSRWGSDGNGYQA
jgi:hypothetical protein